MSVLLISGSPSEHSRTAALLEAVGQRVAQHGVFVDRLVVRNLSPQALLLANAGHPTVLGATRQVERASVVVVATPVYKAAYSGLLKVFLDLLPQSGLKGKTVLPLATGGSAHHMLALDYALRPVLQSLAARQILPGVYATEAHIAKSDTGEYTVGPELNTRLDDAVETLFQEGLRTHRMRSAPIPFSQVRCSV